MRGSMSSTSAVEHISIEEILNNKKICINCNIRMEPKERIEHLEDIWRCSCCGFFSRVIARGSDDLDVYH